MSAEATIAPLTRSMASRTVISERLATSITRGSALAGRTAPCSQPSQSLRSVAIWATKPVPRVDCSAEIAAAESGPAETIRRASARPWASKRKSVARAPAVWPSAATAPPSW